MSCKYNKLLLFTTLFLGSINLSQAVHDQYTNDGKLDWVWLPSYIDQYWPSSDCSKYSTNTATWLKGLHEVDPQSVKDADLKALQEELARANGKWGSWLHWLKGTGIGINGWAIRAVAIVGVIALLAVIFYQRLGRSEPFGNLPPPSSSKNSLILVGVAGFIAIAGAAYYVYREQKDVYELAEEESDFDEEETSGDEVA